jgi:hypothetical protein
MATKTKKAKKPAKPVKDMQQCRRCSASFDRNTIPGAVHLASCRIYNGHTNYETWVVSLWLDNNQGSHEYWGDAAVECRGEALADNNPFLKGLTLTLEDKTRYRLAKRLKEEITADADALMEDSGNEASMFADLMHGAISEVDWDELARGYMENMPELPPETNEDDDSDEE